MRSHRPTSPRRDGEGVAVLRVGGEIDLAVAGDLRAAFDRLREVAPGVVDLSAATLIDSAGIGALVAGVRRCATGSVPVTMRSVATNRGIDVSGSIRAEGDLDFRGTLGIDPDAPVGFRTIRLHFDLRSDEDATVLDDLLATTERYCVVLQTLTGGVVVDVTR